MKRSIRFFCMLGLGASTLAFSGAALAQGTSAEPPSAPAPAGTAQPSAPAGPSKVAVILFQQAVAQTNEGQRGFAQLRTKFAPKQAQLKTLNDEVETLKKQLQASGNTLSEQDRAIRLKTIDEKTKLLQRQAEDDQNDFNSEMNDIYQQLAQKVYQVMDAYAKQHGYTLVLDASNQQNSPVLWTNEASNITEAVVQAYNAKSGVPPQPRTGAAGASAAPSHTAPAHSGTTRTHSR